MKKREIMQALMKLSVAERLMVMEELLHTIREEYSGAHVGDRVIKRKLLNAVELMKEDYAADAELTAFAALDGEDFHDER